MKPVEEIWNIMSRLSTDMIEGLAAVATAHTGIQLPPAEPAKKPAPSAATHPH